MHEPATQRSADAHTRPQTPQLAASERSVSQPLAATPSQSPNPGLQAPSVQTPAGQLAEARASVQGMPQALQFVTVSSELSQPFERSVSQSPRPAVHVSNVQVPVVHEAAAPANAHGTPQSPQSVVVRVLVSHPFARSVSQSPSPSSQAYVQVRDAQLALEPGRSAQGTPHAPQ